MTVAIRAEGLGKQYRLGRRAGSDSLRDSIARSVAAPLRWLRTRTADVSRRGETIWALREASFQIHEGEIIGIIGRNGSGKSTLLKILARITEPTIGQAEIRGRVGSLLEVGTGFHPELTGRENIFVNGAILGMRRAEIARKFDEIVAFADVDQFIDTPVKHYSSGMQMRLAFSVAAHLEPEILLVDEVLAVGDAVFQKKCTGKMSDIARGGRTILLVSHDLTAVQMLCGRVMRLVDGEIAGLGPPAEQVGEYLSQSRASGGVCPKPLSGGITLERFEFSPNPAASGGAVTFEVVLQSQEPTRVHELAVLVHDVLGRRAGVIDFRQPEGAYYAGPGRPLALSARLLALPLVEAEYRIGLSLRSNLAHDILYDLTTLDVTMNPHLQLVPYSSGIRGVVAFDYTIESLEGSPAATLWSKARAI